MYIYDMKVNLNHLQFIFKLRIFWITSFPFNEGVTILPNQVGLIVLFRTGTRLTSLSASNLPLLLLSSLLLITILENLISILSCWLGLVVVWCQWQAVRVSPWPPSFEVKHPLLPHMRFYVIEEL